MGAGQDGERLPVAASCLGWVAVAGGVVAEGLQDGGLFGQAAQPPHDGEGVFKVRGCFLRVAGDQRGAERGLGAGLVIEVRFGEEDGAGAAEPCGCVSGLAAGGERFAQAQQRQRSVPASRTPGPSTGR